MCKWERISGSIWAALSEWECVRGASIEPILTGIGTSGLNHTREYPTAAAPTRPLSPHSFPWSASISCPLFPFVLYPVSHVACRSMLHVACRSTSHVACRVLQAGDADGPAHADAERLAVLPPVASDVPERTQHAQHAKYSMHHATCDARGATRTVWGHRLVRRRFRRVLLRTLRPLVGPRSSAIS
jgi:hypothetical protein